MSYRNLKFRCLLGTTALISLSSGAALGLPQGGVVSGGAASIGAASAGALSITQHSARAVIDWQRFDIGAGEHVNIAQPSASSVLLNRIYDSKPSEIFGRLSANGQVVLSNPNGIVFGAGSQVDVGGLIATTTRFGDTQGFLSGGVLSGTPGEAGAQIISAGQITAREGGLVALVAPQVAHQGVIVAQRGRVQLAAGEVSTYDFYGDGLVSIAAPAGDTARLTVGGTVEARGGRVALSAAQARTVVDSVVNLSGVVEASGLVAQDGGLVLAGAITVTGDQIALQSGSTLRADGPAGGGVIHVGGGWQGAGALPWAKTIRQEAGSTVSVRGTQAGASGGEAVLWSMDRTSVAGTLLATGGSGGVGGRVETSGLKELDVLSTAEVRAGQWLLDPADLVISSGANSNITSSGTAPLLLDQNVDTTPSVVNVGAITAALDMGTNVLVQTDTTGAGTGNITVQNAISTTGSGSLELSAFGSIFVDQAITLQGGNLTLRANRSGAADGSTGSGMIQVNAALATNGGNITLGGGTGTITAGSGYARGLNTATDTLNDGIRISASVNAGGGNIVMNGRGGSNSANSNAGIVVTGATTQVSTSGNGTVSLNGTGGGSGVSSNNAGVLVLSQARVLSQNGALNITGLGGNAAGTGTGGNDGVVVNTTGAVQSVTGDITVRGTGAGTAGGNRGVVVANSGVISSQGGIIQVTGTGSAATGNGNHGIIISNLSSGITNTGSGTITLNGTGGGSGVSNGNDGVRIDSSSVVSTLHGLLSVTGLGGNTLASNTGNNDGVELAVDSSLQIATGGSGGITVNGTAGGAGSGASNRGVALSSGSFIAAAGGAINVTGTGGNTTGNTNHGVLISGVSSRITNSGTGSITLQGTGGGASNSGSNNGVRVDGSGSISAQNGLITVQGLAGGGGTGGDNIGVFIFGESSAIVSNGSGAIQVTGAVSSPTRSGGGNDGVRLWASGSIQALGSGNITINGTGASSSGGSGRGVVLLNSGAVAGGFISANGGAVNISGTGGAGTGNSNFGVNVSGISSRITNTGSGTITLNGSGGGTGTSNQNDGVRIDNTGSVSTLHGLLSVTGFGGNPSGTGTGSNDGVDIRFSGSLQVASGGSGGVIVSGTGAAGTGNNRGVGMGTGASIIGQGGNIAVNGTGGISTGNTNFGIYVTDSSSRITNTGSGMITLSGTGGGAGTSIQNDGIRIDTSAFLSTLHGLISVTGVGGNAAGAGAGGNDGIELVGGGIEILSGGSSSITLNGTGASAATSGANQGVILASSSFVTAQGGNITITGTGGATPVDGNNGIRISGNSARITNTASGAITLTGIGGGSNDSNRNLGVRIDVSAFASVQDGALNVTGIGGGSGLGIRNYGVLLLGGGRLLSQGSGNISIAGTGGNGAGTGFANDGIRIEGEASIQALGNGNLAVSGTGSNASGGQNMGVVITISNAVSLGGFISAQGGDISLIGRGGLSAGDLNYGIFITGASSRITNTGSGAITLNGTGGGVGTSGNHIGVRVDNTAFIETVDGLLSINGIGASGGSTGGNLGVLLADNGTQLRSTALGNLLISGVAGFATSNAVQFSHDDMLSAAAGRTITLSSANGAIMFLGTLNTPADITLSAPSLAFGGEWGGVTRLGSVNIVSGSAMSLPGIRAESLLARTQSGSITLNGALDASATNGTAITLASAGNVANSGAHTLTVGSGARWLIYSNTPTANTLGGLSPDFLRYGCTYGGACGSIPTSGNGLLYRVTPVLVVTPVGFSPFGFGSASPSLVGYNYRLSGYFAGDAALDTVTGSLNGRTNYLPGRGAGAYTISYDSGGLMSLLGYVFDYADNPVGIRVAGSLTPDLSGLLPSSPDALALLERSRVVQTRETGAGEVSDPADAPLSVPQLGSVQRPEAMSDQLYRFSPALAQWLNG